MPSELKFFSNALAVGNSPLQEEKIRVNVKKRRPGEQGIVLERSKLKEGGHLVTFL